MNASKRSEPRARRMADSTGWNLNRRWQLEAINGGVAPDPEPEQDGLWWLISRHASGTASAYVVQRRIRQTYPNVETKVVNTRDTPKEWDAEIWARHKETWQ